MLNSELLAVVAPTIRAAVPVLVNVTVCAAAAAPIVVEANVSAALDSEAPGDPAATATPVPDNETVLVAGVAL